MYVQCVLGRKPLAYLTEFRNMLAVEDYPPNLAASLNLKYLILQTHKVFDLIELGFNTLCPGQLCLFLTLSLQV